MYVKKEQISSMLRITVTSKDGFSAALPERRELTFCTPLSLAPALLLATLEMELSVPDLEDTHLALSPVCLKVLGCCTYLIDFIQS